jgi:glyoxylase-like metal-dependent hydrolase (beta-lactamase superfamily II)
MQITEAGTTIGRTVIQRVVELDRWVFPPSALFPAMPESLVEAGKHWLDARFIDPSSNELILAVQSFVLRAGGRTILVDSCNGNHKERPELPPHHRLNTDYLARLARAGVDPPDVDLVMCTHLHPDHVGWNTRLVDGRWVPTFPNARYLMTKRDFADLEALVARRPQDGIEADLARTYQDSILPVVASEQVQLVDDDHRIERELDHGIWLESAPGHTHGHVVVHIHDGGAHAVITGDVIHHPLQLAALEITQAGDADPPRAAHTRRTLIERYADTASLLLPCHFATPTIGRVVRTGDRFDFTFLDA